jgi:acid stress-induced BolA-like protein IbaG/YrbA
VQAKIKDELQADSVVVSDVYGDGRHVSIDVVSNIFEGKPLH